MSDFRTLDSLDPAGKRVLVRVDLNVPMQDGKVTDFTRIDAVAPTIADLADKGAKVILLAHFDRPKGKRVPEMSLAQVRAALAQHLGRDVAFAEDCVGKTAADAIASLPAGGVLLLENTRFHAGEEKNDPEMAQALADLGDAFVNDAFSAAHRAHASTEGVARLLPAYAGRCMEKELDALTRALEKPERPVAAVVGGAKVSTKIALLENLVSRVDMLVIGGGMANTFLAAQGVDVAKSLCEHDLAGTARTILTAAEKSGCQVLLPVDAAVATEFKAGAPSRTVALADIAADEMILDVGPDTLALIETAFRTAKTLVWNGPLGAFEIAPFDKGTTSAARLAAKFTRENGLVTVAGGGDTVAALAHAGVAQDFSYISTAGGAFLEWLEGKTLPGVAALRK
ncbi:MAG: phosphoglycerate kinase [Alphaproteobacteria bacterium]|nr:phosphoglycerate kinase [Alphaproteobacteria bacterium]MDX5367949.1 phosphoglycerate kinase [Alphaproteobacteria bacterium]MDX5462802.1 phosphoglycerate kinase [Alphaproteobacteria bacterium]